MDMPKRKASAEPYRTELTPESLRMSCFRQAYGTAHLSCNGVLADWKRQLNAGINPNAAAKDRGKKTSMYFRAHVELQND